MVAVNRPVGTANCQSEVGAAADHHAFDDRLTAVGKSALLVQLRLAEEDMPRMNCGLLEVIPAAHPLDAALGIDDSLFASIEGVALTAHLYTHCGLGRPRVEYIPT